ncbi:hypothetical protein [Rhizobium rhizogenes]|uniref:hypothetical protein n=1 Tax=Rhizobium rhizogenes TaxID=359 RepID=UPI00191DC78A|nr:hypothetical protein [Rhizobium rhizogenes]
MSASHKIIEDGGPAFAHAVATVDGNGNPLSIGDVERNPVGMSLRDWFAGQALAGSLAGEPGSHLIPERLAPDCYAFADAMIAAQKGGAA